MESDQWITLSDDDQIDDNDKEEDPLSQVPWKVLIAMIKTNQAMVLEDPKSKVLRIYDHVVNYAQIVGFLTEVKVYEEKSLFRVDDGTGVLSCILWNENRGVWIQGEGPIKDDRLIIGSLVTICGKLILYNGEIILTVQRIRIEPDIHAFILHKLEAMKLEQIYRSKFTKEKESLREVMKKEILRHDKPKFTREDLYKNTNVRRSLNDHHVPYDIWENTIEKEIQFLAEQCLIHPSLYNEFTIINPEFLKPHLVQILQDHNQMKGGFMKIGLLVKKLRSKEHMLSNIPGAMIIETLQLLIHEGKVYQSSPYDCKLLI